MMTSELLQNGFVPSPAILAEIENGWWIVCLHPAIWKAVEPRNQLKNQLLLSEPIT